ncbi:MFS transporter [Leekyejoonella antrihumi]|uniref:MFS transporter n=1 Tax=Leekyejoonella antrihumi TaxID=1660198 RepID=A0A563E7Q9_9MICO|nr:MFS transporter [Leekyejoonella antrihumi]TWP38566.1 MFS transporter [Leekyejoonella antrihumi]
MTQTTGASTASTTRQGLTGGTLLAAAVAVGLAQVALAIPAVFNGLFQQDLHTSSSQLTWISDAFLVPVTLLELTSGVIGDLFGRKRLLVGGAALLTIGSIVCVLTPGASASTQTRVLVLLSGQIIAGIGAAALFPTTLAMVAAGTHGAHERARALTIWAAALSTGGAVSPVLGGLVAKMSFGSDQYASWRWGFIAVAILSVISLVISLLFARDSSAPAGRSLDWPGQITIAIAVFTLLFGVIQGPTDGWGSTRVVGSFIISAVFLVLFVLSERRTDTPLLHLSLFSNRVFAVASIATVLGMLAFLGTAYATSIRLSAIQGFSPLKSSIAFVLLNGIALAMIPVTHRVMVRFNPRWIMGAGLVLIGVGDLWMSQLSAAHVSVGPVIAPLALVGIGFALAVSAVSAVAVNSVPNGLAGMASAATSLLRDLGFTLGPAVIGAIALSRAASEMQEKIAGSPALQHALAAFNAAPQHATGAQKAALEEAVGAVNSGPLGANAVPAAVNPVHNVAFNALNNAYSIGYIICGVLALVAAALAIFVLAGGGNEEAPAEA